MRKVIKFITALLVYPVLWCILPFVKKKMPKKIWLVGELPESARDNGLCFYEYCMNHKYGWVYYVIDKKSPEYTNISNKKNVIQYGSIRHLLYYLLSESIIVCFEGSLCLSYKVEKILKKIRMVHFKEVYMQHGITKDYIHFMSRGEYNPDLFIVSTIKERDYIIEKYKQPEEIVKLTGMARFDNLININKGRKTILVAPTWRRYINDDNFLTSDFFEKYHSLLTHIVCCVGCEYDVILYLHNNFQKYSNYFNDIKGLKILTSKVSEISKLMRESKLLITDYSSIAFDFAYMKKPVIYYHFDHDYFFKNHYSNGYFSYERDGFGDVMYTENEVMDGVRAAVKNNFTNNKKYMKRIDNTFAFTDDKCCERIYKEISGVVHDA